MNGECIIILLKYLFETEDFITMKKIISGILTAAMLLVNLTGMAVDYKETSDCIVSLYNSDAEYSDDFSGYNGWTMTSSSISDGVLNLTVSATGGTSKAVLPNVIYGNALDVAFDIETNGSGGYVNLTAYDVNGNPLLFINLYNGGYAYGVSDYLWEAINSGDNKYSVEIKVENGQSSMYINNSLITTLTTHAQGIAYFEAVSTWSSSVLSIDNLNISANTVNVSGIADITLDDIYIGETPALPETVSVKFENNATVDTLVVWETVSEITAAGAYTIKGSVNVAGKEYEVLAKFNVLSQSLDDNDDNDDNDNNDDDALLKNGGFEKELFGSGGWAFASSGNWYAETATTAERTQEAVHGGTYSIKLNSATAGQRVSLEDGYTYTLTAYVKGATAGEANISFNDGTASYPASNPVVSDTVSVTEEWQEVSLEFECETSQDYVICIDTWDGTTVYFDDITLTAAPTDTTPKWIDVPAIDTSDYTATDVFDTNSGNPIIPGYIGDPFIFQDDDGTFYVLGTTDGYGEDSMGGIGGIYDGMFIDNTSPFCIWYSKDLVNWECKTLLYENGDFPKEESVLWAPAMTKAVNGKYYMAYIYKAYNCYLAEADSPLGPWRDAEGFGGDKLNFGGDETMFDSDIVTLSDGRTYLVTMGAQTDGKNTIWIGRFAEDMQSFDKYEPVFNGGVFEGPGLFERDGKYYLTFSNGSLGNGSYRVDYAMSDDLWGDYTAMGNILSRNDALSINTTGHSNSVKIGDDYYICYHRKIQVGSGGRSGAMQKMKFNNDGTIQYITPTINGARPELTLTNTEKNLVWDSVSVMASSTGNVSALGTGIKWRPEYAVDRNNGTAWVAKNTDEQWYEIDFGSEKEIGRIETFFEYHTLAYQYKIEYSTDGESWTVLSDRTDNTDTAAPAVDSAGYKVTARYIRYTFPEGGVDVMRDAPVGIFEIAVYEDPVKDNETDYISKLEASFATNGNLIYSADYVTDEENPVLYVTVYDENGVLVACKIGSKAGTLMTAEKSGAYTVKAFLWDKNMKPIAKEIKEIPVTYTAEE